MDDLPKSLALCFGFVREWLDRDWLINLSDSLDLCLNMVVVIMKGQDKDVSCITFKTLSMRFGGVLFSEKVIL